MILGGGPEVVKSNVDRGSFVTIDSGIELTPGCPYLLRFRVHHNPVVISGAVISHYISEESLRSDVSKLALDDVGGAWVV